MGTNYEPVKMRAEFVVYGDTAHELEVAADKQLAELGGDRTWQRVIKARPFGLALDGHVYIWSGEVEAVTR